MKDKILLVDKPAKWTSFDVVAKIRGKIRAEYMAQSEKPTKKQLRVGHAGTLDPFATGLLIILLGDACKKAGEFLKLDKTYEFTAKLGEVSTTGDPEGVITPYYVASNKKQVASNDSVIPDLIRDPVGETEQRESSSLQKSIINNPTPDQIQQVLAQFTGEITQTPPAYSAIKVGGKRAYKLAREGKTVDIPPRQVRVDRLELVSYDYPYLKCICDVSSGTYIRSLVEDIGESLETGAYCTELRRTKIGSFLLDDAQQISDL